MFEYLRFRWHLARIERARRWTEKAYERDLREARKLKKAGKDLANIADTARFEDRTYREEIMRLHTGYLFREANRLQIPTPPHDDTDLWEEQVGYFWLTAKGVNQLRSAIRAEKKARWELVLMWVPALTAATGVLGAAIGFAATMFGLFGTSK